MNKKTEQLLAYLVKHYPAASITSLMKLSYLIDLVSCKENDKQVSNFTYKRYNFGPFDQSIYCYINKLVEEKIIIPQLSYSTTGDEYITYIFNSEADEFKFDKLKEKDVNIIEATIDKLKGYGAKALTEIAYKTRPMKALKATLGGSENLNKKLDLSA